MIKINLLSPLDKENLKWEKVNNLAVKNILWVLLSQAIFVGVFFFSIEYLKTKSEAASVRLIDVNARPETKEVASIEREFRQSSKEVESIYEAQTGHVSWTVLFENISGIIPSGVRLENISAKEYVKEAKKGVAAQYDTDAMANQEASAEARKIKVEISGNAKTRELLLALEEKLKGTPVFFDLEYDTGNYVKSTDIDFKYTFYIKEQDLIK